MWPFLTLLRSELSSPAVDYFYIPAVKLTSSLGFHAAVRRDSYADCPMCNHPLAPYITATAVLS